MLIPVVCFGCGKALAAYEKLFLQALQDGKNVREALNQFSTQWHSPEKHVYSALRLCCCRTFTTYMKIGSFLQTIERVSALKP
jgi:DNA-directed RNA polymerase subunit N (RpoN/RPB10)